MDGRNEQDKQDEQERQIRERARTRYLKCAVCHTWTEDSNTIIGVCLQCIRR